MDNFLGKHFRVAALCVGLTWCLGCADLPPAITSPFWGPKSDTVPGITPPKERVAILKSLAARASKSLPEERERVSGDLAGAYQKEDDPLIRAEIVRTLSHYPTAAAGSVLQAALTDTDTDVRITACLAWGRRGGPDAVNRLREVLGSDTELDVRLAAAKALGGSRDPAAIAALGQALEDRDPAMQYCAVQSLRESTGQNLGNDVNRWRQYVKGETPSPPRPVSIADRFRQLF